MKKPSMQIALGIALGAGVGTAIGVAAGHVAVWLAVGIAIGVVIGSNFRGTNCAECEEVHEKHQAKSRAARQLEADLERSPIMALLERVSTLVRANLNDLVDKAEHPEKMIKQVILDMQNQLLQVKTQVAIAIADQHLLEKKQKENEDKVAEWMRKAELSVDKKQDDLARAALQRVESYRDLSEGFAEQVTDQKAQVENLKTALRQLERKLTEAQAKADLLIAQHRRARAVGKASDAKMAAGNGSSANAFDRMKRKVAHAEAHSQAKSEIAADDVEERLAALEKEDRIEQLLAELKTKRGA